MAAVWRQTASTAADTASTKTVATFPSTVASGNAVLAWVAFGNVAVSSYVSIGNEKSGASSGVRVIDQTNGVDSGNSQSFGGGYFLNITSAASTFTASFSSAVPFRAILLDEYSGIAAFDVSKFALQITPGTGANAITTGNTTTAFNGELIYGGVEETNIAAGLSGTSSGAGYTFRSAATSASADLKSEYLTQPTAGATTVTWTDSVNGATGHYLTGLMSFQASTAAGGAVFPPFYVGDWNGLGVGGRFFKNKLQ